MSAESTERRAGFISAIEGWPDTVIALMAKHQQGETAPTNQRTRIALGQCRALARRERGALEFEIAVRDISLNGVGFESAESVHPGQQLVLNFPSTEQRTAWLVEVRWAESTDSGTMVGAEVVQQTSWKLK